MPRISALPHRPLTINASQSVSSAVVYIPLTFTVGGTNNCIIVGNGTTTVSICKKDGSIGWDTAATTASPYAAPLTVEFQNTYASAVDPQNNYCMFGLIGTASTNLFTYSYTSLDQAFYPYYTGNINVYQQGTQVNIPTSWNSSQTIYIVWKTNNTVSFYNGPTLIAGPYSYTTSGVYLRYAGYNPNGSFPSALNAGITNIRATTRIWNGSAYQ
jgi:hypothetical protein